VDHGADGTRPAGRGLRGTAGSSGGGVGWEASIDGDTGRMGAAIEILTVGI
jgi:hypothetical protein